MLLSRRVVIETRPRLRAARLDCWHSISPSKQRLCVISVLVVIDGGCVAFERFLALIYFEVRLPAIRTGRLPVAERRQSCVAGIIPNLFRVETSLPGLLLKICASSYEGF